MSLGNAVRMSPDFAPVKRIEKEKSIKLVTINIEYWNRYEVGRLRTAEGTGLEPMSAVADISPGAEIYSIKKLQISLKLIS